jgi:hypothetical protein
LKRCILSTVAAVVFLAGTFAAGGFQSPPDLDTVLTRAARYVVLYEDSQLGNVLAAEQYDQEAMIGRIVVQRRRTLSDFLIVAIGNERFGVRRVNRVDGKPAESGEDSLDALADASPDGLRRRIAALKQQSVAYNIGPILREINIPTFALKIARAEEAPRFTFTRTDTDRVSGIDTWEIRFRERRSPTLVHGLNGESLLSTGALWIEPATGRVLKTELSVENAFSTPPVQGRIVVTYKRDAKLDILVPAEMTEQYSSASGIVYATARYSNFRPFQVEVSERVEPDRSSQPGLR